MTCDVTSGMTSEVKKSFTSEVKKRTIPASAAAILLML